MYLWIALTLLVLMPACGISRKRGDPAADAVTHCEWVATQMARSGSEKFDQETFRRPPSMKLGEPEEFWRDTFLRGQPVTSTKLRCIEDGNATSFIILDKIDHRTPRPPAR